MPDFTLNPKQTIDLDKPISEVTVHIGTALVSLSGREAKPHFLEAGDSPLDCENLAPTFIYSPDSAVVSVLYTEEVTAAPAEPRGDTGDEATGSFESRTVKQLKATVKERGITVKSKK